MQVSRDRINWTTLAGDWYASAGGRSIFAENSVVTKYNDTSLTASDSLEKIPIASNKPSSRVINVSGQIIGASIYDCRDKQELIQSQVIGEKVYFYDEYFQKVFVGNVTNVNENINRGEAQGRAALLSFSITLLSPYYEELLITEQQVVNQSSITVANSGLVTPYKLVVTPASYPAPLTGIFTDKIMFSESITLTTGQRIEIDTREGDITAVITNGTTSTSILSKLTDVFYTDYTKLAAGANVFSVQSALVSIGSTIKFSFYKRSL